jgi:hypothetical protein
VRAKQHKKKGVSRLKEYAPRRQKKTKNQADAGITGNPAWFQAATPPNKALALL